ncbi:MULTISPECIES: XkdX family protein [Staphylococcus]|nr:MULTISPECIES: XkdX family protein [Staphylococcus]
MSYNSLKYLYDEGLYTNEQFKIFVRVNWVTPEQYFECTGVEYKA